MNCDFLYVPEIVDYTRAHMKMDFLVYEVHL